MAKITRNHDRKLRYAAMAAEKDKEGRNRAISDTIGVNLTAAQENDAYLRSRTKEALQEEKRLKRALDKAKDNPKELQKAKAAYDRRIDRKELKSFKKLDGFSVVQNRLSKNGSEQAQSRVTHFKHKENECGNLGCEKCNPASSRRRQNESPLQHLVRRFPDATNRQIAAKGESRALFSYVE